MLGHSLITPYVLPEKLLEYIFLRDNLFYFFSVAWNCPDLISCHLLTLQPGPYLLSFSAWWVLGKKLDLRKI